MVSFVEDASVLVLVLSSKKFKMSLWNAKNYSNSYIPKVSQPIDNYADLCLDEVFEKQKAVDYLRNPKKYLTNTEVLNFGIINANLEGRGKPDIDYLQEKADAIKFVDFDRYGKKNKVKAFKGTLKWKGKKSALVDVKDEMKDFLRENEKCKFHCMC